MGVFKKKNIFYALYTMAATLFFIWYLFPSEFVADYIEKYAKQARAGLTLEIKGAKPAFPFGLKLRGIEVGHEDRVYTADYVKVAPDLISVMKLAPVIKLSSGVFGGAVSCKVKIPKAKTDQLVFEDVVASGVKLEKLSGFAQTYIPGYSISGELEAEGSYSLAGRGKGMLKISLDDLLVKTEKPMFSVDTLSFPNVTAEFELKSKKLEIKTCEINGNEVDGSVKGFVFIRNPMERSTVKVSGTFKPEREFIEKLSQTVPVQALLGKKLENDDGIPFKVSGVVTSPKFSLK